MDISKALIHSPDMHYYVFTYIYQSFLNYSICTIHIILLYSLICIPENFCCLSFDKNRKKLEFILGLRSNT